MIRPVPVLDSHQRPLANLRLSVTDRCNLRCQYCMPEADYLWLPREDILQFEEIDRLVDQFLALGVEKVRLTGGEPLLRRDLPALIERLALKQRIRDLANRMNRGDLSQAELEALRRAATQLRRLSGDPLAAQPDVMLRLIDQIELQALAATAKSREAASARATLPDPDSPRYREAVAEYYRRLGNK